MADTGEITIFHNPRCSKSRQTLTLLEQHDIQPKVRLYLQNPPGKEELKKVLAQLALSPRELLRKTEAEYKELGLADPTLDDEALLDAMVMHPRLIERPIVIKGNRAVLGRPPENVKQLI